MRATFFTTLALASRTSAAFLGVRQATPPACSTSCLNNETNNVSTGSCSATDLACLCASQSYIQGIVNCLDAACSTTADVDTGVQYMTAYCAAAGVNNIPSVTTAAIGPTQTSQTFEFTGTTVTTGSVTASGVTISHSLTPFTTAFHSATPSPSTSTTSTSSSSIPSTSTSSSSKSRTSIAVIIASIVGVLIITALLCAFLYFRWRKRVQTPTEDPPQHPSTPPDLSYSDPLPMTYAHQLTYQALSTPDKSTLEPVPYTIPTFTESQGDRSHSPPLQERTYVTSPPLSPSSPPPPSVISHGQPPTYRSPGPNSLMLEPDTFMPSFVDPDRGGRDDDEIGRFAAAHRNVISRELEAKLRRSGYKPTDDPKEMPIDVWVSQYGIGHFEVKRLQEIYDSTVGQQRQTE